VVRYWTNPPSAILAADISEGAGVAYLDEFNAGVFTDGDQLIVGHECWEIIGGGSSPAIVIDREKRGTFARKHRAGTVVRGIGHGLVASYGGDTWDYSGGRWGAILEGHAKWTSPGGPSELTFVINDYDYGSGFKSTPTPGALIYLCDADGPAGHYWDGIVADVYIQKRRKISATITITALGPSYFATENVFEVSYKLDAYHPIYEAMKWARDQLCPDIITDNSRILAGTRSILADSGDQLNHTAMDTWNEFAAMGDPDGDQILWHVYARASDNAFILEVVNRPGFVEYEVASDQLEGFAMRWSLPDMKNRAVVRYKGGVAQYQVNSPTGRVRTQPIDATSQIDSQGMAYYVAQTNVWRNKDLIPQGDAIVIPNGAYVLNNLGTPSQQPIHRIIAGKKINVTGFNPGNDALLVPDGHFIREADWDLVRHSKTITTEKLKGDVQAIGQLLKADEQRVDSPIHPAVAAIQGNDNAPAPGQSGVGVTAGGDGRVGFRKLPVGLNLKPLPMQIGAGGYQDPEITGGETTYIGIPWKTKVIKVYLRRGKPVSDGVDTEDGDITVEFAKSTPADWPTTTPLGAGSTPFLVTITGAFKPDPDPAEFPADTKLNVNDYIVMRVLGDPAPRATTIVNAWVYIEQQPSASSVGTDTTPPSITVAPTLSVVDGHTHVIFTTSEDCVCQVEFGQTTTYGNTSEFDESQDTSHDIDIKSVAPTDLHLRIRMIDLSGNVGLSGDYAF